MELVADKYILLKYLESLKLYFDRHSDVVEGFLSYPKLETEADYTRTEEIRASNKKMWKTLSESEKELIVDTVISGFEFVGVTNIHSYIKKGDFGEFEKCKDIILEFRDTFPDVLALNCSGYLYKIILETCIYNKYSIFNKYLSYPTMSKGS